MQQGYHLSGPAITNRILLPTLQRLQPYGCNRAGRPPPLIYMAFQHTRFTHSTDYPMEPWALTPRFHPYPDAGTGTVIFCGTFFPQNFGPAEPAVNRCAALCCPDFPSPRFNRGTITRLIDCKGSYLALSIFLLLVQRLW